MIGCGGKECGAECGQMMGNFGPMGHCDSKGECRYGKYALGCKENSNGEFIQT